VLQTRKLEQIGKATTEAVALPQRQTL